jgi:hypothetical protein
MTPQRLAAFPIREEGGDDDGRDDDGFATG